MSLQLVVDGARTSRQRHEAQAYPEIGFGKPGHPTALLVFANDSGIELVVIIPGPEIDGLGDLVDNPSRQTVWNEHEIVRRTTGC